MHRVLQKAKTIHTFENCTGSSVIMPLEKQNTGKERRKNTQRKEKRGEEKEKEKETTD